jgi:hypothetical protein
MQGEIHKGYVLYSESPEPGHRYRQIVVTEGQGQFLVRIFGGDVIQPDPQFDATNDDAEVYFHPDLQSALDDAHKEVRASVESGWKIYGS